MSDGWEVAVAAYGVSSGLSLPQRVLGDGDWAALLAATRAQRLTGFLAAAVADGAFPTTDDQYTDAAEAHLAAMALVLRLERLLLNVAEQFAIAGIDMRVLKGSAVAHRFYPDPSLRSFNDVDVLVPSDAFDEAVRVLARCGGARQYPQPRPGFDRRFSKGTSFDMPCGLEVDLHRTFASGPFGLTVRLDDLWERSWPFQLGGVELRALDLEPCFLGLCYHAALGDAVPKLLALRDIAQVLACAELDDVRVRSLARGWRAEAALARAMSLTALTLDLGMPHPLIDWARGYRADRVSSRALSAYTHPGNAYGRQAVAAVRCIPGLASKAAYVRALVWPDEDYVSGQYRGRWDRWGRSVQVVRRLRRDP